VRVELGSERHGRATMLQPLPALLAEHAAGGELEAAAEALGLRREQISSDRGPLAVMDNGLRIAIVPLDSLATVQALAPSAQAIARFTERLGTRTLLAFTTETVEAGSAAHCRVYAPGAGVYEDPATGSANGPFGVYLARYGLAASDEMAVEQGYEMGRPSRLHVSLGRDGNGEVAEVRVGGGVFVTGEARMFF
jgi:trans-2,3-dihydro-3-hydroxyanthranilate isomerase